MLKVIKIRLYPVDNQVVYINKLLGTSRFIYNKCLDYKIKEYEDNKKSVSFGELGKHLVSLKSEYEWIKDVHSKVLQQSLINLNMASNNYFTKLKSGEVAKTKSKLISEFNKKGKEIKWDRVNDVCKPKFKSKHDTKQSCRFPVDAISGVKGNRINIIRDLKDINFKCSRKDEKFLNKNQDKIKSATLTKTKSGNYYFSVLIDRPNKMIKKPTNQIVGIDLGVKDFIVSSEGATFENIKIKRNNQDKLNKLHRELSRKKKGSINREKTRIKLSRSYEKINNQKEYYLHSVVNQLLGENQTIIIEDLNVRGMLKNHKMARSIQELSLYRFKEILTYKAKWYGREVITIDRWFPSSKLCHCCGYKNDELTLNDREWVCPDCGVIHDRDLNAAINIRNEGQRIKIGMSCPELTPTESSSLESRRSRNDQVKSHEKVLL